MRQIHVIDSHTEGEPTRVVPVGELDVPGTTMLDRRSFLRDELDHFRRGLVLEPRGSEIIVGAILTPPVNQGSTVGVVFFNNASYLGMCGHGAMGVVATLKHLGAIGLGTCRLDTPVGTVTATVREDGQIEIVNVPSYRYLQKVSLDLPSFGTVVGEVCYGGNWFYILEVDALEISLSNKKTLDLLCEEIKVGLSDRRITGKDGAKIDHIEITKKSENPEVDSVNFVMCPGDQYDRSPCGTGTSAKIALLIEEGRLAPNEWYVQGSVTGTRFRAKGEIVNGEIIPTISGRAWIVSDAQLIFDDGDPLCWGFS